MFIESLIPSALEPALDLIKTTFWPELLQVGCDHRLPVRDHFLSAREIEGR